MLSAIRRRVSNTRWYVDSLYLASSLCYPSCGSKAMLCCPCRFSENAAVVGSESWEELVRRIASRRVEKSTTEFRWPDARRVSKISSICPPDKAAANQESNGQMTPTVGGSECPRTLRSADDVSILVTSESSLEDFTNLQLHQSALTCTFSCLQCSRAPRKRQDGTFRSRHKARFCQVCYMITAISAYGC